VAHNAGLVSRISRSERDKRFSSSAKCRPHQGRHRFYHDATDMMPPLLSCRAITPRSAEGVYSRGQKEHGNRFRMRLPGALLPWTASPSTAFRWVGKDPRIQPLPARVQPTEPSSPTSWKPQAYMTPPRCLRKNLSQCLTPVAWFLVLPLGARADLSLHGVHVVPHV